MFKFLHGTTKVKLADSSTIQIKDLVKNKSLDSVLTIKDCQKIEKSKIKYWHQNIKTPDQFWLKIAFCERHKCHYGEWGTLCLNNQLFLTRRGWIRADNLDVSDYVATGEPEFTIKQKQVLIGMLLGDGHCTEKSKGFVIQHCIEQDCWLRAKARLFNIQKFGYYEIPRKTKISKGYRALINANRHFWTLRRKFYQPDRQPILELVDNLDIIGLTTWFLDNGSSKFSDTGGFKGCSIAIHSFNNESRNLMKSILYKNFNIEIQICSDIFLINKENAFKLYDLIKEFVPNCMQYKLHPNFRNKFNPDHYIYENNNITSWYQVEKVNFNEYYNKSVLSYGLELEDSDNLITTGGTVKSYEEIKYDHNLKK